MDHPPLLPEHGEDGAGGAPVLDPPGLRLRTLDPTLGHVKRDVDTTAEGACRQAQANLNISGIFLNLMTYYSADLPTEF